jgi:hypothetical protein
MPSGGLGSCLWRHMPVINEVKRMRQEDHEFECLYKRNGREGEWKKSPHTVVHFLYRICTIYFFICIFYPQLNILFTG